MSDPTIPPARTVLGHHFCAQRHLDDARELYEDWVNDRADGADVQAAFLAAVVEATALAEQFTRDHHVAEDARELLADLDTAWGENR